MLDGCSLFLTLSEKWAVEYLLALAPSALHSQWCGEHPVPRRWVISNGVDYFNYSWSCGANSPCWLCSINARNITSLTVGTLKKEMRKGGKGREKEMEHRNMSETGQKSKESDCRETERKRQWGNYVKELYGKGLREKNGGMVCWMVSMSSPFRHRSENWPQAMAGPCGSTYSWPVTLLLLPWAVFWGICGVWMTVVLFFFF